VKKNAFVHLLMKGDFNQNTYQPSSSFNEHNPFMVKKGFKDSKRDDMHTSILQYGDPKRAKQEDDLTNWNSEKTLTRLNKDGLKDSLQAQVLKNSGFMRVYDIEGLINPDAKTNILAQFFDATVDSMKKCPEPVCRVDEKLNADTRVCECANGDMKTKRGNCPPVCIKTRQGLNDARNECVCIGGSELKDDGKCVCKGVQNEWIPAANECGCIGGSGLNENNVCECKGHQNEWNKKSKQCELNCIGDQKLNKVKGSCDNPDCKGDQNLNKNKGTCDNPECIGNETLDKHIGIYVFPLTFKACVFLLSASGTRP
jgi:hypothetical protein